MRRVLAVLATSCLAGSLSAASLSRPVLLVERDDDAGQAIGRSLRERLALRSELRWIDYAAAELGDPIYKGKLLATLGEARLVIAVGDEPTGFVLEELEDTPVYFVGASLVAGRDLSAPRVAGVLGYSPEDVLAALPKDWKRGVGLLYGSGYGPVAVSIKSLAAKAGVELSARRVERRDDIVPAARALLDSARVLWVLGDPALSRGAGFEFLVEESLARSVPLIGSGAWETRHGAVFCSRAKPEALAEKASSIILRILEGTSPRPRVETAAAGGQLVFHPGLAARFKLSPRPPDWVEAR